MVCGGLAECTGPVCVVRAGWRLRELTLLSYQNGLSTEPCSNTLVHRLVEDTGRANHCECLVNVGYEDFFL